MRVIICGAGQVGYGIAEYLSREDNDVTVVDNNPQMIGRINAELDVKGMVGHASSPDVLSAAGGNNADMIIAVTYSDEVNMVACEVAHSLFNIPKKIARVRNQSYLDPSWGNLFGRTHLPVDVVISPEIEVARSIVQRLQVPGTTSVALLAEGRIYLVGVICGKNCPVLNTQLRQLNTLFPDLSLVIGIINRNGQTIIPMGQERIELGDEVFFFTDVRYLSRTLSAFGHDEKQARSIVIVGGGNIGMYLAGLLKKNFTQANVKIIEQNKDRAYFLSQILKDVIVLQGDALSKEILQDADVANAETFIAVTNDDESNILGSVLAKQKGCQRTIALVNGTTYSTLTTPLGIDVVVSPRASTVSTIMQHVRRGRIKALHTVRDGFAEVIEAEVSETSPIANKTIEDFDLSDDVRIGAIVRDESILVPSRDLLIKPGDHVIVLAAAGQVRKVEQLFTVQVDFF